MRDSTRPPIPPERLRLRRRQLLQFSTAGVLVSVSRTLACSSTSPVEGAPDEDASSDAGVASDDAASPDTGIDATTAVDASDPADLPPLTVEGAHYLSPDGDDAADGLSPNSAWKTISHLNQRFADGTIGAGGTVLFECGRTFHGKIRPPHGLDPKGAPLTIGAYRTGSDVRRPTISSYKRLTIEAGWKKFGGSVWSVDLSNEKFGQTHSGYDGAEGGGGNVGFLKVDGTIHGKRVFQRTQLAAPWDFYCEGNVLYVWATANPATLSNDIQASCDGACIAAQNALRVTHLRLEGSGGHGVQGSASNVRVDDCEFAELGGALLYDTTRYGNGFEAWIDSADVLVEKNVFHDIYDVAMTAQGGPDSSKGSWTNIRYRNNLVYLCNQSFEFWSDGNPTKDPGFVGCVVECNTCLYAGYGWSSNVRPDQATRVHLLTYGWKLPADIQVRNNTFYDGFVAYRYSDAANPAVGLACSGNLVYQRAGKPIKYGDPQTIEQSSDWKAAAHNDLDSTFRVLPAESKIDVAAALKEVAGQRAGCAPPALP